MDEALEKAWPFAAIVITLILAYGYFQVNQNNNESDIKREIVSTCAAADDIDSCAKELTNTLNELN